MYFWTGISGNETFIKPIIFFKLPNKVIVPTVNISRDKLSFSKEKLY